MEIAQNAYNKLFYVKSVYLSIPQGIPMQFFAQQW